MKRHHARLECGCIYHIYNRGNNKENLFKEINNYDFFLGKFVDYISPIANTFSYCLLPNHFHFLLQLKRIHEQPTAIKKIRDDLVYSALAKVFSNLFNCYSRSYNNRYNRTGKLFSLPYNRILVDDEIYFSKLIHYIHSNPVKHKICEKLEDWPYSSYHEIAYGDSIDSFLEKEELIEVFGGLDEFVRSHKYYVEKLKTESIDVNLKENF